MLFSGIQRLKDQKYYRNWIKETVFVYILGFMSFLAQKMIYTINIWFNFVFGSFSEQDHLLNFLFQEFMLKDDLNVHLFQYKNYCSPKSDRWFFSNFGCQRSFP